MKRRIFSLLIALCIIVGLLPTAAFQHAHAAVETKTVYVMSGAATGAFSITATSDGETISYTKNQEITLTDADGNPLVDADGNPQTEWIQEPAVVTDEKTDAWNAKFFYDTAEKRYKLILKGVRVTRTCNYAFGAARNTDNYTMYIYITEDCYFDNGGSAICSNQGATQGWYHTYITSENNATLYIHQDGRAGSAGARSSIHVMRGLTINANITITQKFTSKVNQYAIRAAGATTKTDNIVTINGGNISITNNQFTSGGSAYPAVYGANGIVINGGTIEVTNNRSDSDGRGALSRKPDLTGYNGFFNMYTSKTGAAVHEFTQTRYFKIEPATEETHTHTYKTVTENEVKENCGVAGSHDTVVRCSQCNAEISRETVTVPATGAHTLVEHAAADPQIDVAGNSAYWSCDVCGKFFSDAEGTQEIEKDSWILPALPEPEEPTCEHADVTPYEAKASTCKELGNSAYYFCNGCEKYFAEETCQTEIEEGSWMLTELAAHTAAEAVKENEVAATCGADGSYDEVVYCSVCEAELSREEKTEAATGEHVYNLTNTKPATCEAAGEKTFTCGCGASYTEPIAKLAHTAAEAVKENEVAATCGADGSYDEVVYCSECGAEMSREKKTEPATGKHVYNLTDTKPATCEAAGEKTFTCGCGASYTEPIAKLGHTAAEAVKENEVAATCGADGSYDEVVYCSECGAEMSREKKTEPATGKHVYNLTDTKPATCEAAGEKTFTCGCGASYTEPIAKLGHDWADATCTAPKTCKTCGATEGTALDHAWNAGVITVKPTGETEGEKTFTCENDASHTKTETMPVLPEAIVKKLGAITYTGDYAIFDLLGGTGLSNGTGGFNMQVAMQFIAKDTAEEAAASYYGDYTTDFYIEINGLTDGLADEGCYLAGYYAMYGGWVLIPLNGMTIEDGVVYPVITSAGFDFSYEMICGDVKDFTCGICFSDEFLAKNPNVEVTLSMGLSEDYDKAIAADFLTVDEYVYDEADLNVAPVASVNGVKFYNLEDAVAYAQEGNEIMLLADVTAEGFVNATGETIDLNGFTLTADILATIKMNGGTFKTTKYTMVGEDGLYKSADAIFTVSGEKLDVTIHSGTMALNQAKWYTGEGQLLKIEKNAIFVIPQGSELYVNGSNVIVEGTAANFGTLTLANGAHLKGDVAGTFKMAGGTFETSKYVMIGATEGKYLSTDAVFTVMPNEQMDMTVVSGTITLDDADWWTLAGQTLTIAKDAKFVVPAGKNINVQGTVIVDGIAVVDGTVTLYNKTATVKAAEGLNVITNAGDKVWYTEGKYIVHDHTEETISGKDATCTEAGLTEGKKCTVCGETTVAQEEIKALGHKEETLPGKDATCTETGLTEGKKCSVCGETTVAQEEIKALGHTEEPIPGKDATCTETGLTEGKKCTVCGETTVAQEEIKALGHKEETLPGKDATCTEAGLTKGKKCSVCGEILVAQKKIPALGHSYADDEATECSVCHAARATITITGNDVCVNANGTTVKQVHVFYLESLDGIDINDWSQLKAVATRFRSITKTEFALENGTYVLWVEFADADGKVYSASYDVTIAHNPAQPEVTVTGNTVTVGGEDVNVKQVHVFYLESLDGIDINNWSLLKEKAFRFRSLTKTEFTLENGTYVLWVECIDANGKVYSNSCDVTVAHNPAQPKIDVVGNKVTVSDADIKQIHVFNITGVDVDDIDINMWSQLKGVAIGFRSPTKNQFTLASGTHVVWVGCVDAYGNAYNYSQVVTV